MVLLLTLEFLTILFWITEWAQIHGSASGAGLADVPSTESEGYHVGSTPEQRECAGYDGKGVDGKGIGSCTSIHQPRRLLVPYANFG
jgi:hypothetical protein